MIFNQHTISQPLSRYIENIFHYKDFVPEHSFERVVPTGNIYILFELDGITRHLLDNETLLPITDFTKVWISGMHRHFITISTHSQSEMLGIQFKPGGTFPFLHLPAEELNDKIINAEEILGVEILKLREKIINAFTPVEKFSLVEEWLCHILRPDYDPPIILNDLLISIQLQPTTNYNEILKDYPKTQKHLIHQFKKYVGLTPKYYQRILRFNEILQRIKKEEKISWTQVAYSCNYSDQSHFIKEFKHFSGFNPAKYIDMDYHKGDTNFFPIN